MRAQKKSTLKSILALFGSNIATSVLGMVAGLLSARILGPDINGQFRVYTIPLTYLTFLHVGTFDGLWRQIPYYDGKNMPDQVDAIAASAGSWNFWVSVLSSSGFSIAALLCLQKSDYYGFGGWAAQAFCCWSLFYGGYLGATYRTLHQFVTYARVQTIQAVLSFVLVSTLPYLKFYGLCVRSALPVMASLVIYQIKRPLKVRYKFNTAAFRDLLKIGLPFCMFGSLNTSVWLATESALILYFGGEKSLGFLSVAIAVREGMNTLPNAVYQVMMPRVVKTYAQEGSVNKVIKRVALLTMCLTLLMLVGVAIGAWLLDCLIPIFLPAYVDGLPLMYACLGFSVVQAASLPLNAIFAAGNVWAHARGIIAGILVFFASTYALLQLTDGPLSVVVGSLLGRLARTLVAYIEIAVMTRRERLDERRS